ncbi:TonB-dependent receptor [Phenylobacterium sp.]|uniref:TonB-dependent receptor n=1 Tax=Phenylobacterium sp. TaxID=1871053 RepID=UPI0035B44760|nr:TonB-dependent receptor [Pseudomonadota bacterium]
MTKLMWLAGAAALAMAGTAQAQSDVQVEEVVVTAQKREGTVQATPLAVSAISGDVLQQQNVVDAGDLTGKVPNLNIGQAGNEVIISIRGVSSAGVVPQRDPSVAFHLDGVYLPRPSGANSVFYDLERVEVLRGPQGTLWGRNATAGSLNIITRKPVMNTGQAAGELLVGNYGRFTAQGMYNFPILDDTLAARAAFIVNRRDGYQENVTPNMPDLADAQEEAGRVHLLFTPGERLRLLLSADYYHAGGAGTGSVLLGNGPVSYIASGRSDPYRAETNTPGHINNKIWGVTAEATYSLDALDIVSVTAYRADDQNVTSDSDGTATGTQTTYYYNKNKTFSQELRLASSGEGALKYILGAFYIKETNDDNLFQYTNLARTAGVILQRPERFAESWAVFGQADYDITDSLTVFAGVRYSEDRKGNPVGLTRPIGTNVNTFRPDAGSWAKTTWRVGADWEITPDNMVYGSVSTGYKAGGFSSNRNFGPETLTAYEVGSKNYFFDRRLLANLSAFYYDYKDLQVVSVAPDENGVVRALTTNAGVSTVWGIEFEGRARITEALSIDGSFGYLDAKFDRYVGAIDPLYGTVQDLSGNTLPRAPRWNGNIGVAYAIPLASGQLTARISTRYQSKVYFTEFNNIPIVTGGATIFPYRIASQDDYTATDISLRYDDDRGWYAEAFADNLEDEAVLVSVSTDSARNFFGSYAAPRTFGVKAGFKFN